MKSTGEVNHELTIMVKESEQRAKEEADRKAKSLVLSNPTLCRRPSV